MAPAIVASNTVCDDHAVLRGAVLDGLSTKQKTLPCRYLYDEVGCELFDEICDLPEYYPTRTEVRIMTDHVAEMAAWMGSRAVVVEYGSGSGLKTERLLAALDTPAAYVPVEIAPEFLEPSVERLRDRFSDLDVRPVCADFTMRFPLPGLPRNAGRRIVYFPGSTIGNFTPEARRKLLAQMADLVRPDGGVLLGLDLIKSPTVLEAAYDDAAGVTAAFNLNLLRRINRELGADFNLETFTHRAVWNGAASRIEMHLVSQKRQNVSIGNDVFEFSRLETICTEYSHKFDLESFSVMAESVGLRMTQTWFDEQKLFAVVALDRISD